MDKKVVGIVGLVISAICLFIAIERYSTNANNVAAMNQLGGSLFGQNLKPATPAATKLGLVFALVFGIGGGVLLTQGAKAKNS